MSQGYEKAITFLNEALMLSREQEDMPTTGATLRDLAELAHKQGDNTHAMALLQESLDSFRNVGHKLGIAYSLRDLANIARDSAKYAHAIGLYKESLALFQEEGIMVGIISGLVGLAKIAKAQAQMRRGARLLGAAEALCESSAEALPPALRAALDQEIAAVRSQLGETAWAVVWAQRRAMTINQAIAYAIDDDI
jgi:tetratricopeptide (TPR) repeat protein